MDVTTPEQAKIAEAAGACAVMALERIPAEEAGEQNANQTTDKDADKSETDRQC